MNELASTYLLPPVSLVVLMAIAVLWLAAGMPRHRRGLARLCIALAAASLLVTLPVVSKVLVWPLRALVADWEAEGRPPVGAVVVPTGGSYEDPLGGRWPTNATVNRAVLGAALAAEHGLPLAISGGSPKELPHSEAGLAVDLLGLDRGDVLLDLTARNTHENALAFARLLHPRSIRSVLLVTDTIHVSRMAASLRAAGFQVYGQALGINIDAPIEPRDVFPSNRGLRYLGQVAAGYGGILYYLVRGEFAFRHLMGATENGSPIGNRPQ